MWISVETRLPDDGQSVLVYEPHCKGQNANGMTAESYTGGDPDYGKWITHWMPLPEPPENN